MKKVYEPLNMLMNGRYAVLLGKLSEEERKDVLARMEKLIGEEREYEDKGNYSHLCNILSTIAIDEVLQAGGKSPEEAYEIISSHMWASLTPETFQKISKMPFFLGVMRKLIPYAFKYGSGKGWRYTWFKGEPKNRFSFECNECLYKYEFGKRGLLERFGPMFCHSDVINYGNLHKIEFRRSQTLCQGGEKCDFCFISSRK